MVRFWILLGSTVYLGPDIDKDDPLALLYECLTLNSVGPKQKLANVEIEHCKFYRFATPLPVTKSGQGNLKACLDASDDWIQLEQYAQVGHLVDDEKHLTFKYICLIIELPQAKREKVIYELSKSQHLPLFKCLQIHLKDMSSWSKDDVVHNMKGGTFLRHGQHRTVPAIAELESGLAEKRSYFANETDSQHRLDFQTASNYPADFQKYFVPTITRSYSVKNSYEFVALFYLLRSHENVGLVSDESSSSFKATYTSSTFFIPPFFTCRRPESGLSFKADMPWKFPIMLAEREDPSNWVRINPKSDYSVVSHKFLCPFMICEVISNKEEVDRWRMLVQAIATARVGYYLQKSRTQYGPFFVTAIYVRANLTAERYVVMQTNQDDKVSIAQTDYDLCNSDQALDFLRAMFNLQGKMESMLEGLDDAKKDALSAIEKIAHDLTSLTSRRAAFRGHPRSRRTHETIEEDPGEQDEGTRRNPFIEDPEIVERLDDMGYQVVGALFQFKHVVKIRHKTNESGRGYLKITKREREVEILQHLSRINSPDNHTICGVQVWTRNSGGYVIYMSAGGGHITALEKPGEHVWSAAIQLVEGVGFMHKHGIAHQDIKPSNVLIPPRGGRLSIIDYSISAFVQGSKARSREMVGTDGFMAPEVCAGKEYDPIRADLWSCGRTLEELCLICAPSMRVSFIVDIARELMAVDPIRRPAMGQVLTRMTAFASSLSECGPQMRLNAHLVAAEVHS